MYYLQHYKCIVKGYFTTVSLLLYYLAKTIIIKHLMLHFVIDGGHSLQSCVLLYAVKHPVCPLRATIPFCGGPIGSAKVLGIELGSAH